MISGPIPTLLPLELFGELVQHMDNYTLRALLRAFPALQSRCLLITDQPLSKKAQFFHNLPRLKRSGMSFNPNKNGRYLLKLYEFNPPEFETYTADHERSVCLRHTYKPRACLRFMDKCSFVVVHDKMSWRFDGECGLEWLSFERRLLEKGVHFHVELGLGGHTGSEPWKRNLSDTCLNLGPPWDTSRNFSDPRCRIRSLADLPRLSNWGELVELTVEGINNFDGLKLLKLKSLCIHFNTVAAKQRPSITKCDFPGLFVFRVLYYDRFPLITDVTAGHLRVADNSHKTLLELTHLPSLEWQKQQHPVSTTLEEMQECNLSFSAKFRNFKIIGGHSYTIMMLLDWTMMRALEWSHTSPVLEMFAFDEGAIHTQLALSEQNDLASTASMWDSLTIRTSIPNFVVPAPLRSVLLLRSLVIETSAKGLDLNGIFDQSLQALRSVSIHAWGQKKTVGWFNYNQFQSKPNLKDLSLVGYALDPRGYRDTSIPSFQRVSRHSRYPVSLPLAEAQKRVWRRAWRV